VSEGAGRGCSQLGRKCTVPGSPVIDMEFASKLAKMNRERRAPRPSKLRRTYLKNKEIKRQIQLQVNEGKHCKTSLEN
jgi:hypothetical protein